MTVLSGESVDSAEIIELCGGARALYVLVTLLCREQSRITPCALLWQEALSIFEAASKIWQDVPLDGELVALHRRQLERLCDLARDRVALYTVNGAERRALAVRRADISITLPSPSHAVEVRSPTA
jgi:hypothetical protein